MEGERGGGDAERLGDGPGRQARAARLDEQPEGVEPRLLRERGQGGDGVLLFHFSISIEI